MPEVVPDRSGGSAVLAGSFNPAIFQPQWFAAQGLISRGEADAAEIQIVHPQVTQFNTETFYLQVTPEQFVLGSKPNTTAEPIRDLAVGTFYILEHTPITALGINRQMHIPMSSEAAWHRLGDKLAPKVAWSALLPARPGMETLEISSPVPDRPAGTKINVRVQPSKQIQFGAYFEVNCHYAVSSPESAREECMEILKTEWKEKQEHALRIANDIVHWSEQE